MNNCLLIGTSLPRPQALIKKFHASHYMKGLHEVVHRDEQAQGVMGLEASKIEERLGDLVPFLAKFVCFLQIVVFRQFGGFFRHFFEETTFQIVQLNM